MPRKNIYFKEAIEKQIQALVDAELEKGASSAEVNFSSKVNDLVQKGLWVEQHQSEGSNFDRKAYDIDMLRKAAGTREAIPLLIAMVTQLYALSTGQGTQQEIEAMMDGHLDNISSAENDAEKKHFGEVS